MIVLCVQEWVYMKVNIYAIVCWVLIPCALISYDALTNCIGHYSKRDRHKYQDDEVEKELHELVFRVQSRIYDGAFLRKLTAKSFIVDIRPGSN